MNEIFKHVNSEIIKIGLNYRYLNNQEYNEWLLFVLKHIEALGENDKAGESRIEKWNSGWAESYDKSSYIPGYFGKYPILRMGGKLVYAEDTADVCLEYQSLCFLQEYIFKKYLSDVDYAYEFGCGTGHNLVRVSWANQKLRGICGLDWVDTSLKSVDSLNGFMYNVSSKKFNMFDPDFDFELKRNSAVITIASMEQLGADFQSFVSYLLKNKPKYVIHIEPINELLSPDNLLDYLSIKYAEKRNYLSGYLGYLRILEKENIIKILQCERSYIGSLFIDGYSVLVWEVI